LNDPQYGDKRRRIEVLFKGTNTAGKGES